MRRPLPIMVALLLVAGCGGDKQASSPTATAMPKSTPTSIATPSITIAAADRPACALLYARLQRVTAALQTSSELIAHSLNPKQLSHRIAIQQTQLERSARLMTGGPIPAPLEAADRQLVSALRAFARDFARAKGPAARGNFQTAVAAMTDAPVVQRILRASRTIESACRQG